MFTFRAVAIAFVIGCSSAACAEDIPRNISRQLPPGYVVLTSVSSSVDPTHKFYLVALASRSETEQISNLSESPSRPLLIYRQSSDGRYALVARNDHVILRANDGGIAANGCDPFEERRIATRGRYLTVENGVACGAHWTDYVAFRFDAASGGYVFDNWRYESWSMNRSNDPKVEALVSDGQKIMRANSRRVVPFAKWRRPSN